MFGKYSVKIGPYTVTMRTAHYLNFVLFSVNRMIIRRNPVKRTKSDPRARRKIVTVTKMTNPNAVKTRTATAIATKRNPTRKRKKIPKILKRKTTK